METVLKNGGNLPSCLKSTPDHPDRKWYVYSVIKIFVFKIEKKKVQGCDCAANWLILVDFDTNVLLFEIGVNQVMCGHLCCSIAVFQRL